jgi:hypothetical protein
MIAKIIIIVFFYGYGIICLMCGVIVLIFKHEHNLKKLKLEGKTPEDDHARNVTVWGTWKTLWRILKLSPVKKLVFILLTIRVR